MAKIKLVLFNLLIMFVSVYGLLQPSTAKSAAETLASYTSPEGIEFISSSKSWDEEKLQQLYEIFIHNEHREELALLRKVFLSTADRGLVSAEINLAYNQNLLGTPTEVVPDRTITLYNADQVVDMNEMSYLLAHEYGHLFTYYWLIKKEQKLPADPQTEWAHIRKLDAYPVQWQKTAEFGDAIWDPGEIMADEYVTLFGSKASRAGMFNTNDSLPPAEQVAGLKDYWIGLSEDESVNASIGGVVLQSLAAEIAAFFH